MPLAPWQRIEGFSDSRRPLCRTSPGSTPQNLLFKALNFEVVCQNRGTQCRPQHIVVLITGKGTPHFAKPPYSYVAGHNVDTLMGLKWHALCASCSSFGLPVG